MMSQFLWGPTIFAGFLILIFPLVGTGAAYAAAESSMKLEEESSTSFVDLPPREYKAPRDLLRFLEANAGLSKPPGVDKTLWLLLGLQNKYLKSYESQLFSDAINPKLNRYSIAELVDLRTIQEENIKSLIRNILADGFMLSSAEGMVYAEIDFPAISARFSRYASAPVAGYLRIMARETGQHFAGDGALMISPEVLGRRIISIETFLRENRRFARRNDLVTLAQKYLTAYLLGLNNTPAFSYRTSRIDGRFLQSYHHCVAQYRGTRLAVWVKDYLRVLAENDYQKTKPVVDLANKAANEYLQRY
jgi:hypothetical protein